MIDRNDSSGTSRRGFLAGALAAGISLAADRVLGAVPTTRPSRPNLVLLLTDDQRADFLGCAGHPILKTPNIDKLAAAGVRFVNAFATSAICVTSRASILTGLYPEGHTVHDFTTPLSADLWAESFPMLLRKAGYRTGFVGKWGLDGGPLPTGDYDSFTGYAQQGRYFEPGSTKHLTSRQAEQAISFVESCKPSQPFCLQVSFKAPHVQDEGRHRPGIYAKYPYDPAHYWLYNDVQTPPPQVMDRRPLPPFLERSMNRTREGPDFEAASFQETMQHLYRLHAGIDDAVGAITAAIDRLGFGPNTVVVYAADHGSFYGEHGFGGKWLMHEPSIRSPLIVAGPRVAVPQRGTTLDQMALNVDLCPTLLDLAGVPIPPRRHGRSLVPLLDGQTPTWRTDWLYQQRFANAPTEPIAACEGVRTVDRKYIRYLNPPVEQLFDLEADPFERNDLAAENPHDPELNHFRDRLVELKASAKRLIG